MAKGFDEIATEITVAYVQAAGQVGSSTVSIGLLDQDAVAKFYETIYLKVRELGRGTRYEAMK